MSDKVLPSSEVTWKSTSFTFTNLAGGWEGVLSSEMFSHHSNLNTADTYLNKKNTYWPAELKQHTTQHHLCMLNISDTYFCVPLNQYLTWISRNPLGCSFNDLSGQIINCHVSLFQRVCLALTLICKANQWKRQGFLDVWPTEQQKLLFSCLFFSSPPTFAWTSTQKLSNFPAVWRPSWRSAHNRKKDGRDKKSLTKPEHSGLLACPGVNGGWCLCYGMLMKLQYSQMPSLFPPATGQRG